MSAPRLFVVFELERRPRAYFDARDDGEISRLIDWLAAHPGFGEKLAAVLAEREQQRAAGGERAA